MKVGLYLRVVRGAKGITLAGLFLAVVLGVTLFLSATVFGVPGGDIPEVAVLLVGVGGAVGVVALFLMRPAILGRLGGVRGHLVGYGLIGSFLLVGMVLAGARAMFISSHDLSVLLTMLLFASLMAVAFSLYGAVPLARRVEQLRAATERLARGDLEAEVPVEGHDELAGLAEDFNRMSRSLKLAARREREMEASRRELVAAVSHDLRTPLASTRAMVEAVSDGVAGDREAEARYLAAARGELEKLGRLVEDLFELARLDSGAVSLELEVVSLSDLVSDTLASFGMQATGKGIELVGEVADGVDPVLADIPGLQRVLYNLVGNALRYTPEGGTVGIRAGVGPSGFAEVEVSDTGDGISPEDLDRVFERSFRGERSRTSNGAHDDVGAGLGLAIAKGLVEAHGGEIHAESRVGAGSVFTFTLQRT